jgi:hypothetical protein
VRRGGRGWFEGAIPELSSASIPPNSLRKSMNPIQGYPTHPTQLPKELAGVQWPPKE